MKNEYEEFFSWLLDKEVTLDSEIDISTEKEIYYPEEIKAIIDTKDIQRLKKVMQLSTVITENEGAYHTRYDHSLGTYNNGVTLYLNQYKNNEWKKYNSSEERRVEIIASLIELLTHDLGHLTYSHTLEQLIGKSGTHEQITDRIVEEKLTPVLEKINPKLPQILKERKKEYEFATLKEGNIDLDRMDYLLHDVIYIDEEIPEIENKIENILNHTTVQKVNGVEIPVFDNEIVPDIQEFLKFRAKQYEKYYYSNERGASDNICNIFCNIISRQEEPICPEFTEYLQNCIKNKTNLDLTLHENWNDIHTINSFITIAENSEDEELSKVAISCLPTLNGMINLVYKMIEFPETVDRKNANLEELIPDDNERKLYETVKKYVKGTDLTEREKTIRENLLLKNNIDKDIIIYEFDSEEDVKKFQTQLDEIGIPKELINQITWSKKIKNYSKKCPNFAKTNTGEIVELSNHPDFKMDEIHKSINGGVFYKDLMKAYGLSDEKINQTESLFENLKLHQKEQHIPNKRPSNVFDKEDALLGR